MASRTADELLRIIAEAPQSFDAHLASAEIKRRLVAAEAVKDAEAARIERQAAKEQRRAANRAEWRKERDEQALLDMPTPPGKM